MSINRRVTVLFITILVLTASLTVVVARAAQPNDPPGQVEVLQFDIAQDMTRFSVDESPADPESGAPVGGAPFIIPGYLYPAGALDGAEYGGVMPDGSPEFPDLVVGEWVCRGWFIGDGILTTEGPLAVTTQMYHLYGEGEWDTIITEGYEYADPTPFQRAITGGAGKYQNAGGEMAQQLIGANATEAPNQRVELTVYVK